MADLNSRTSASEMYDHIMAEHPGISEPSDLSKSYLRDLHDDLHVNDESPLERSAGDFRFVVPRGYYGEATHTHG